MGDNSAMDQRPIHGGKMLPAWRFMRSKTE